MNTEENDQGCEIVREWVWWRLLYPLRAGKDSENVAFELKNERE